jgi:hypothetical protein
VGVSGSAAISADEQIRTIVINFGSLPSGGHLPAKVTVGEINRAGPPKVGGCVSAQFHQRGIWNIFSSVKTELILLGK